MPRLCLTAVLAVGLGWALTAAPARAQQYPLPPPANLSIGNFFDYPYYYFPHSYWPQQCPPWPEKPGQPYMRPPAYMTYPAFKEPHWDYMWLQPHRYYRGFHFWLDQF